MPQMTSGHINTYSFPNGGHCQIQRLLPLQAGLLTFQLLRDSSTDSNLSAASAAETASSQPHWQAPAVCWQSALGPSDGGLQQNAAFLGIQEGETWISHLNSSPEYVATIEILLLDTFVLICCVHCQIDGTCPTPSLFWNGIM